MGSWKAGSPTSNPLWLKTQSRQLFIASEVLVAWKHGADFCKMPQQIGRGRGDHKPKNLIETSLWEAWLWVAWIEEGQQILGTENLQRKIIRFHHLFTTQTSTLTMFELDCDSRLNISPFPTLWYFHELNVFAKALLLNKPCLWGLCVQSSIIKHTAHIHLVHLFGTLLDFLTWWILDLSGSGRNSASRYVQLICKQLFDNIVSQCVAPRTSQSINVVDASNCESSRALSTQSALAMYK